MRIKIIILCLLLSPAMWSCSRSSKTDDSFLILLKRLDKVIHYPFGVDKIYNFTLPINDSIYTFYAVLATNPFIKNHDCVSRAIFMVREQGEQLLVCDSAKLAVVDCIFDDDPFETLFTDDDDLFFIYHDQKKDKSEGWTMLSNFEYSPQMDCWVHLSTHIKTYGKIKGQLKGEFFDVPVHYRDTLLPRDLGPLTLSQYDATAIISQHEPKGKPLISFDDIEMIAEEL